jgi:hypothetical protein
MNNEFKLNPAKTYASEANARKAAEKLCENNSKLRFMVVGVPNTDRFAPVFIGIDSLNVVHSGFTVVA